jgi:hypothetical protein
MVRRIFTTGLAILISCTAAGIAAFASAGGGGSALAGGARRGVHLRGHWQISVQNADGSLARDREFENALTPEGAEKLGQIYAGERNAGLMSVILFGTTGPCLDGTVEQECVIGEPERPGEPAEWLFKNLELNLDDETGVLTLEGSATAGVDTSIERVSTRLSTCDKTIAPVDCQLAGGTVLTRAEITPIPVTAGQFIAVTVELSFV